MRTRHALTTISMALCLLTGLVAQSNDARRAITPEDKLVNRQALLWGGVILAGLIFWLTGLSQA